MSRRNAALTKLRRPVAVPPSPSVVPVKAVPPNPPSAETLDKNYCESKYLYAFADVAKVVADGSLSSGLEHFVRLGRSEILAGSRRFPEGFVLTNGLSLVDDSAPAEGKRSCRLNFGFDRNDFDEVLYRALFPDVAAEIEKGNLKSGFEHWLEFGYREVAAGHRYLNFELSCNTGQITNGNTVFELQDSEFLMAFPDALAAVTPRAPPRPDIHRIELPQRRALHFGKLLQRPYGVNFFGPLAMESGLGSVARGMLRAVQMAGLAVDVWPYDTVDTFRLMPDAQTRQPRFRVNLLVVNADTLPHLFNLYPPGTFDDAYNVSVWHWELCSFRPDYMLSFIDIDEVWTTSRFELNAITPLSPLPVRLIPAPVMARPGYDRRGPGIPNIPEGVFVFIAILDLRSRTCRKNPSAVIAAFRELVANGDDAALILKFHGGETHADVVDELMAAARSCRQIYVIDASLNERELEQLRDRADCLVSAHRSEGFGLNIAEFLALGKTVIATGYSGNTDFFDEEVGYPVEYDLVELPTAISPYPASYVWAEPRVSSLVAQMRHALRDRDDRLKRAAAGAKRIANEYSPAQVGHRIRVRLAELQLDIQSPRFVDVAQGGQRVLQATPSPHHHCRLQPGQRITFSIPVIVPPSAELEEMQIVLDRLESQTYGLRELILQPLAGCESAVLEWLNKLRGTSPRLRVQVPPEIGCAPKPGLVETATAAFVVYIQSPAQLGSNTLEKVANIFFNEPACEIVYRKTRSTKLNLIAIRKQLLLEMGMTDLQPEQALSESFRMQLRAITNLMRELPNDR
jgi:glycosyltransferase involved in cell wall biosynthesis